MLGKGLLTNMFQFTRPQGARPEVYSAFLGFVAFQFTRPQGARLAMTAIFVIGRLFQFTRPQGARHLFPIGSGTLCRVSIHAPARGATILNRNFLKNSMFQFTRPQGARPRAVLVYSVGKKFQFTRPQGARQCIARRCAPPKKVSIHAPARGATDPPVRRLAFLQRFNSRARKGRDTTDGPVAVPGPVSIHAPARGATCGECVP